ncbi:MAG: RidA family protein [Rhodospirillaceae bacterium]|nr:RidA family protein [Rhodospirillaceae bacterium]
MAQQGPFKRVAAAGVPEPPPSLYSNCLVAGDTIYVSGQHAGGASGPPDGDASMTGQARTTLARVKALIEAAGATMADVIKLTVFTTDIGQRAAIAEVRREFFAGDFPCSTMVEIRALVHPSLLIEIEAIAIRGSARG